MKKNKAVIAVGICCIVALVATIVLGFLPPKSNFIKPPFDESVIVGVPDVPSNLAYSPLEIEPGYTVKFCANLANVNQSVDIFFASPESNKVWMSLTMTDENGEVLGKTDLIKPGEYIKNIKLIEDVEDNTKINIKITAYEIDTYSSKGSIQIKNVIRK